MISLDVLGLGVVLPGADKPADARTVPDTPAPGWFDVVTALTGRGYKRLPTACQYLLAATRNALDDAGDPQEAVPAERRGVVVGTNNAGMALMEDQDHSILEEGADAISPITAPYFAMSLFASRLAVEHTVHGFTLTTNSPRTAGFDAVQAGARALARGRADLLVVGATEEALPSAEPGAEDSDIGAVALVCARSRGAPDPAAYGSCRVLSAFLPPGVEPADVLDDTWAALTADGPRPDRVEAVLDDSPTGRAVSDWLAGKAATVSVSPARPGCLSPMRHLVARLATGDDGPEHVVVTAAAEGNVAFARLTTFPDNHPQLHGSWQ
ncbi:beta-ketoacyl synthase N-terminal-like domain-containing protein [Streptomyces sp. NPDC001401]|uniref:beta-ketoacyl synthase N-terminal-like domain-containing protein n=1 Tax=Streptomyces sp. NPDC001401 TaxID=3364570 RepID=UPI0036B8C6D5